jgi:hypothetical protein
MIKRNKEVIAALALIFSLAVLTTVIYADSTATNIHFNIQSLVAYTLTLPGESATVGGADAQTTDIEFNITGNQGVYSDVQPKVVGGTTQSDGTPIFQFDNTGTVNLNISVNLNESLPSCLSLKGATTYENVAAGAPINETTNTTVTTVFTPSGAAVDWYMMADFNNCVASDSSIILLRTYGVQS